MLGELAWARGLALAKCFLCNSCSEHGLFVKVLVSSCHGLDDVHQGLFVMGHLERKLSDGLSLPSTACLVLHTV